MEEEESHSRNTHYLGIMSSSAVRDCIVFYWKYNFLLIKLNSEFSSFLNTDSPLHKYWFGQSLKQCLIRKK